jgi:hypothetical protein
MTETTGRAAAYRKIREQRQNAEPTFEVTLPSGAVFVLRRPDPSIFAVTGALPLTLPEKMEKARLKGKTDAEAFQTLSVKEQTAGIEVTSKLVRLACVSPRIVDYPDPNADEIAPDDLLLEDYNFIAMWIQTGGGESDSLDSFRDERQSDAVVELDIKEFGHESQPSFEHTQ